MTLYRKANKLRLITLAKAPALVSFSILHKNLIDYNRIKLKNKKCARHETGIKEIKNKNHLISPPKKDLEKDFYLEGQRVVGICLFVLSYFFKILSGVQGPGSIRCLLDFQKSPSSDLRKLPLATSSLARQLRGLESSLRWLRNSSGRLVASLLASISATCRTEVGEAVRGYFWVRCCLLLLLLLLLFLKHCPYSRVQGPV